MDVSKDDGELEQLQEWLSSYKPNEIFNKDGSPNKTILDILPGKAENRLGQRKVTYDNHEPLKMPEWKPYAVEKGSEASCMKTIGKFLDQVLVDNPKSMRIFSPDELVSNKLDAVFDHTGRDFQWDEFSNHRGGRVIEMLSEHTIQGFLQGYTLTGRTGLFPSYESFLGIVHTMMVQYSKFNKVARETTWHGDISSINYIETSTWTRQEHNGFSHQNPSFIGAVLNLKPTAARVYLPPDGNTWLSTLDHCLRSKNYVNLMVGSKQPSPIYFSVDEAEAHCRAGGGIMKVASTDGGSKPDVVLVGIGAELTFEVVCAAAILRKRVPDLRVRVVNVTDIMILEPKGLHPHALDTDAFDALFTDDRAVHFNYHGYSTELKGLLFGRPNLDRVTIESYKEEGTTTTPFDMMLKNCVSRYHVMEAALNGGAKVNERVRLQLVEELAWARQQVNKTQDFVLEHGKGEFAVHIPPEVTRSTNLLSCRSRRNV